MRHKWIHPSDVLVLGVKVSSFTVAVIVENLHVYCKRHYCPLEPAKCRADRPVNLVSLCPVPHDCWSNAKNPIYICCVSPNWTFVLVLDRGNNPSKLPLRLQSWGWRRKKAPTAPRYPSCLKKYAILLSLDQNLMAYDSVAIVCQCPPMNDPPK